MSNARTGGNPDFTSGQKHYLDVICARTRMNRIALMRDRIVLGNVLKKGGEEKARLPNGQYRDILPEFGYAPVGGGTWVCRLDDGEVYALWEKGTGGDDIGFVLMSAEDLEELSATIQGERAADIEKNELVALMFRVLDSGVSLGLQKIDEVQKEDRDREKSPVREFEAAMARREGREQDALAIEVALVEQEEADRALLKRERARLRGLPEPAVNEPAIA